MRQGRFYSFQIDLKDKKVIVTEVTVTENAEPNSRLQKYFITDNFLNFWFRFLYRNYSAIETENFNYIKTLLKRDYLTYCGKILEKFYHSLFAGTGKYNRIGSYWEKGNQNEIDLVAVNDMKKEIVVAEIKMNPSRINPGALKRKSKKLIASYPGYRPKWIGLSLKDAMKYL